MMCAHTFPHEHSEGVQVMFIELHRDTQQDAIPSGLDWDIDEATCTVDMKHTS